jgi:signal transduction histidine kinase
LLLTRQAMRPINAACAAQRAFVADASHELRTPLKLIRTNAEVLLEAGAVSDVEDRALLADIVGEAEHMGRLIADLLTLARLHAGVLPLESAPVALAALVTTCCRQMAQLAERHDVHLANGAVAPLVVLGDAARLEQVLLHGPPAVEQPGGHPPGRIRGGRRALDAVPGVLPFINCSCDSHGFPMDAV